MKPRLRAKDDGTFAWMWGGWLDGLREVDIWVGGYPTAAAAFRAAELARLLANRAKFDANNPDAFHPPPSPSVLPTPRWAVRLNPGADDGRCYQCRRWPGPSGLCKNCRTPQPRAA